MRFNFTILSNPRNISDNNKETTDKTKVKKLFQIIISAKEAGDIVSARKVCFSFSSAINIIIQPDDTQENTAPTIIKIINKGSSSPVSPMRSYKNARKIGITGIKTIVVFLKKSFKSFSKIAKIRFTLIFLTPLQLFVRKLLLMSENQYGSVLTVRWK